MVARHRCRGGPRKIIVQHLSQFRVRGEPGIGQSQIEAHNRTTIHFIVLAIPAVHPDDCGFVTIRVGIRSRATECLTPISCEALDVLGVEAVAERMDHNSVGHHPMMPSRSKTAQAVVATRRLEDSLHTFIMTVTSGKCKPEWAR